MTITIGGKPVQPKKPATRVGKHRQLTMEQIKKRHPAEPFPPISQFRNETVEHRISVGCELKMWAEQKLDELASLVDEERWLSRQVENAEYADHPARPQAVKRRKELREEIAEIASDVAYLEAHADRIWQSLDAADREPLALAWVAEVSEERIILNAWTRIAQVGFRWPPNTLVNRRWFECLAPPLIDDMNARGLKDGVPLGEQADPFEQEEP